MGTLLLVFFKPYNLTDIPFISVGILAHRGKSKYREPNLFLVNLPSNGAVVITIPLEFPAQQVRSLACTSC